jgi:hypothetical protein
MANIADPMGFVPVKTGGKELTVNYHPKTAGEVIYPGDLVKRVAAGTVQVCGAGVTSGIVGVAAAYSAAASTDDVPVYDDPAGEYIGQCDGTTAFAAADIGMNVDVAAGTPNTGLKRSGMVIDMATKAVTATLPFKILGLAPAVNGNDNTAAVSARLRLLLNVSDRKTGTLGI